MSTFDTYADSPFHIKREGQEITVTMSRLSPTTIRATWTLPNAVSCNLPGAYNGAIVTVDNTATAPSKLPSDGSIYKSDSTADKNLHAGSQIGSALVVGAFYNDTQTNTVDITDAPDGVPYYISVHAVDNVYRYHTDGVHSYSLPYGNGNTEVATAATQILTVGQTGIFGTTPTQLDPTKDYSFTLTVDQFPDMLINLHGADIQTYQQLVDAINKAILLKDNPPQLAQPPFKGTFWYNNATKVLSQFDGEKYNPILNTILYGSDPLLIGPGAFWYDPNNSTDPLQVFTVPNGWVSAEYMEWPRDPRIIYCNDYWLKGTDLFKWNGGTWIPQIVIASTLDPALPPILDCNSYWYHDGKLYQYDEATCTWKEVPFVTVKPTNPTTAVIFIDAVNHIAQIYSVAQGIWIDINVYWEGTDPMLPPVLDQGIVWYDSISDAYFVLDGTSWKQLNVLKTPDMPQAVQNGAIWYNTKTKVFNVLTSGNWIPITAITFGTTATDTNPPNVPTEGRFWMDTTNNRLWIFDGSEWVSLQVSMSAVYPVNGYTYFDTTEQVLKTWNGSKYVTQLPVATVKINDKGNLEFTSATTGSMSWVCVKVLGSLFTYSTGGVQPPVTANAPQKGTDPLSQLPMYMQQGVGTDGSQDERRNMVDRIKMGLGYPVMPVELTKDQMDLAIDLALEKLRSSSSVAYKRGYFALGLIPRQQHYRLTDQTVGFHKIVDIYYVYRQSTNFISAATGNDVFGQMIIQSLYNSGKFDLLSYHMVSSYIETMAQIFAAEIQFTWDETSRTLSIYKDFNTPETVLIDTIVERTEQDLMTDRQTRNWITRYASAQARYMLAEIRGKFSALPGASGNVTLNAADLRTKADQDIQECMDEIDNFVVNDKVNVGMASDFVLG